jgi:hypothetical protein
MRINKVFIRDINIPVKNGTVRKLDFGDTMSIEVELDLHPTVVNFINLAGFFKERVRIIAENGAEIAGKFTILTGTLGILLTGDKNEVAGSEQFNLIPSYPRTYVPNSDKECSLNNELKSKPGSILITFLTSLLENNMKDSANREFLFALAEKLKTGQSLNNFDHYILEEIRYFLEETISNTNSLTTTVFAE